MNTKTLFLLLCLAPVLLAGAAPGPAEAVHSIRLVLPHKPGAGMENIARIFARQVSQRCDAKTTLAGNAPLRVTLAIEPGLGTEGFKIADDSHGGVRIIGNDARGLLYGVGKFLHSSRYDQGGFTAGHWRGTSVPEGSLRGIYLATHFMNFYEAAPAQEVQSYVEDLGLWGLNAVFVHFPTEQFNGFDDPAARRSLEQLHRIFQTSKAIGLQVGLIQVPNQGFATAPQEIRGVRIPDSHDGGNYGVNCCPSKPAGHEYLLNLYAHLFDEFKDIGLDDLLCGPYDAGGCACSNCWPWGARGFPKLSRDVIQAARARFPAMKCILSTWDYDVIWNGPPVGEWEGLAKFLETDKGWADYIQADSMSGDYPRYPLDQGVPGGLPLLNFPEISNYGRKPWGGYGANPLPARFERLWKQTQGKLAGGTPYSEGIYEDINKVICLQYYWQTTRTAEDNLKEYLAFEYSPDVVEQLSEAVGLLEKTWTKRGPDSEQAFALLQEVETKLTPQAKAGWRWRILYLRGLIDNELFHRHDKMEGPALKSAFDELTKIYHAENTPYDWVKPPQVTSTGP
jgi:hypothetical protein